MRLAQWIAHPIHLPYPRHIQWASADEDGADYLLLRLVTDDGIVGVAEGVAKPAWQSVNPRALAVVIEELFIPLLVDNGCRSVEAAALFLEQDAQALSLKLSGTGVTEAQRMAALAHAQNCAAHMGFIGETSLGALVALQVASALPTRGYSLPAETTFFLTFGEEYVAERVRVEDGRVRLPAVPGLGRWVDWERVSAFHA